MMEWFLIYAFVMIEKFSSALGMGWLAFWCGLALIGLTLFAASFAAIDDHVKTMEKIKEPVFAACTKIGKWCMILGFIAGALSHFVPSQKDLAIIVGSGVTYKAVTSETGKRLGGKAIELLEKKLDDAMGTTVESLPQAETPKAPAKTTNGQAL